MIDPDIAQPGRTPRLPALRYRGFRLLWFGQMISLTGTWVQTTAQQWLVLTITHSPFKVGLLVTVQFIPLLCLVLFAGAVADRVDRRVLLIVTQVLAMTLAVILGTLTILHVVRYWEILAVAFGIGAVNAFYVPARQSFVPELVPRESLLNAVALNSSIFNGARVVGPALGGLLYAATGPAWAFYINAASYVAVMAGLLLIRRVDRLYRSAPSEERDPGTYLNALLEGLRYIRRDTRVLVILSLVGIASLFALNFTTLLPIFAKFVLHLNSDGFGILLGAQGAGSLLASLALSVYSRQELARRFIYGGALVFLSLELLFALTTNFGLALALLLPTGFFMTIFTTTANSRVLELAPDNLQGRVMSVYSLMFLGMTPFGSLLAGAVAQRFGAPSAFWLGAGITMAATATIYLWRQRVRARAVATA